MYIAVIFDNSLGYVVELIKMFYLKFYKIHLNKVPDMLIFEIFYCMLIKLVYNIIVDEIIVCCLTV